MLNCTAILEERFGISTEQAYSLSRFIEQNGWVCDTFNDELDIHATQGNAQITEEELQDLFNTWQGMSHA